MIAALALSMNGAAQEKKSDMPAAGQQDKIDIGGTLDSWYKILQKDQLVGYAHEYLRRAPAGGNYRYSYTADAEVELVVPDAKDPKKEAIRTESTRVQQCQLDDTYAPLSLERTDIRDESTLVSKVINDDSGRRIAMTVGTEQKNFPVSPDEEVHYSRFLMFISLRQNGKLAKPGTQRALLFEPRPEDPSPIVEVNLEVHEMQKRAYFDKKEVSVTKVTYLKPPPAANRDAELLEAYVDKFGRIVEESTRGGVHRIIVKDETEAVGQNERVRHGGRRDPFRKDLAMAPAAAPPSGDAGTKVPPVDPKNIAKSLKEIEAQIEELRKAKEEKRDDEGQKLYDRLILYFATIRQTAGATITPDEQARLEVLRQQVEEIWGGLARLMKQLRGVYVQVTDAFNKDDCASMEKGIEDLKKAVATRKELEETQEMTQVLKWIGELEPLVQKCKTRIELSRKKLVLTGTMLHEDVQVLPVDVSVSVAGVLVGGVMDVKFTKPNRIAVINEKMYRVGDVVEGEGVRVEKIWAFGIQVSLREETRDVGIRQQK
jgi:hypothetical protein